MQMSRASDEQASRFYSRRGRQKARIFPQVNARARARIYMLRVYLYVYYYIHAQDLVFVLEARRGQRDSTLGSPIRRTRITLN